VEAAVELMGQPWQERLDLEVLVVVVMGVMQLLVPTEQQTQAAVAVVVDLQETTQDLLVAQAAPASLFLNGDKWILRFTSSTE
jgi:hypothetical protein